MRPPRSIRALFALAIALPVSSEALEVRGYSQALDNRLLDFPGAPIYPQTPQPNAGFIHAPAAGFHGIGWPAHPTDWTRQMALVSPRHFVYASHYPLGADWNIAFLGTDGQQHLYQIESQVPVVNTLGQQTDLMLCTLTGEVQATTGVAPFPVLNLTDEAAYTGLPMIVFGGFVRAGTTPLAGFTTLVNDPGFDTTRFAYFDYNHDSGNPRECDYQGGDSGAPSFIMDGGKPAIIGIASGRDPQGWGGLPANVSRNYIAFIPAYLPQLDAAMETKGFHMIRSRPAATTMQLQLQGSPVLRRLKPGALDLVISNNGSAAAHNTSLTLQSAHSPAGVSAPGMITDAPSGALRCRRGGLATAGQSALTLQWNQLPNEDELEISSTLHFDGGAPVSLQLSLPLLETYASWSTGLGNPAESADPDHDGLSNLLEYALGGTPENASLMDPYGTPLAPRIEVSGNHTHFRFRRRIDAAARGLVYQVETSANPQSGDWTGTLPPGSATMVSPASPPSTEFEIVDVSIPLSPGRRFFRLKVALSE